MQMIFPGRWIGGSSSRSPTSSPASAAPREPAASRAWRPPPGAPRTAKTRPSRINPARGPSAVAWLTSRMGPRAYAYPGHVADDLPTGRWRRAAKVGRLASGQTARGYATKAANLTRSEQGRHDAAARRQMQAAEQIFEVLGQMKGAAMKVGQVASFMDTGAFPPEFQERVQAKLAEFDEQAVAAASIGQVYRGRLHDGREVAVKVQYPGVAQAMRADLQNLGLIMRVAKRMAPGM